MDMEAFDRRQIGSRLLGNHIEHLVCVLACLLSQSPLNFLAVVMLEILDLDIPEDVVVLLRVVLLLGDWLNGDVVMVLVNLLVKSSGYVLERRLASAG